MSEQYELLLSVLHTAMKEMEMATEELKEGSIMRALPHIAGGASWATTAFTSGAAHWKAQNQTPETAALGGMTSDAQKQTVKAKRFLERILPSGE